MSAVLAALARLNDPAYPLPAEPWAIDLAAPTRLVGLHLQVDRLRYRLLWPCATQACDRVFRSGDRRIKRCTTCRGVSH